ncbi:MAG: META domain-containing protein [Alphaproteobacteria bacterium]|nr:META domain-containing protein [Alphaproteobacteria bacterium]
MKSLIPLAVLLAIASARAQSPPAGPASEGQPPAAEVMYVCPGGADFSAVFSKDGELATLNMPGQPDVELSRLSSGSGFAYGDSYYELRGRGREATLTAAGRSIRCHAVGRPGQPPRTYAGGSVTATLFPDGVFRLRDGTAGGEPVLDVGQWAQEVDGGVRMVLRGGTVGRRVFREASGDRLIGENGVALARTATVDPIDGLFNLTGLYRDTQNGGLFTECFTGRTFAVAPSGAEPDLERAWTEVTPSKDAQLFVEIVGRFVPNELRAERFVSLKRDGACPPPPPRSSALRDTDWRVVEIDGERPVFEDWRQRPSLKLEDGDRYTGSTGCNAISGRFELDPDGLRFVAPTTTLTACPPAVAGGERRFLDALAAVRQAQITATTLDLKDAAGKRRLRLEARGR